MTEIFLNNKQIDLFSAGENDIVVTYAVNDLFTIESNEGSYSNTFKIPATHTNNIILEALNNVLSASDLPTNVISAQIYVNGAIQVDGFCELVSASSIEYEIRIFTGNSVWFEGIKEKLIGEAFDLCEDNFYWRGTHVNSNRITTWVDKIIYPNADYGYQFFKPATAPYVVEFYELYPAVWCKFLFKRIFDRLNLSISSNWFDTNTLFEKQIIPFSAYWKRDKNYTKRNYFLWEADQDHTSPIVLPDDILFYGVNVNAPYSTYTYREENCYQFPAIRDWEFIYTSPTPSAFITQDMLWINNDSGKAIINYNITIEKITAVSPAFAKVGIAYYNSDGFFDTDYEFELLLDLQAAPVGTIQNIQGSITIDDFGRGAFSLFIGNLEVKQGSTFEFELEAFGDDDGELDITYDRFPYVTLGSTLPQITQESFINTIANQYGLVFDQDPINNQIRIFQFLDVGSNIANAIDWSSKIDLEQKPVIRFLKNEYARKSYLRYSRDENDEYLMRLGENYGEGFIENLNGQSGTEEEIFVSDFAPINREKSFSGAVELAYFPIYDNDFQLLVGRMAYIEFNDTSRIEVLLQNPVNQPQIYFDDLIFQNLIEEYYQQYRRTINVGKSVNCLLRLNSIDILNLDFSKPIYIDYFNAYFYINEVSQYNITRTDSTNVELILIDF